MAGFNFINYNKEGPGVSKNEKQKKGFFRFFEIYFSNFWKLMVQGFTSLLLSLPIVTYFIGETGLTHITRSLSRGQHSFGTSDFFEAVRKNWKQSLLIGIINEVVTAILAYNTVAYFLSERPDNIMVGISLGVSAGLLFIFTVMKYYMPFMVITFSLKTGQVYKNAFKFVFLNLKKNLLVFFSLLAFAAATFSIAYFGRHVGAAIASVLTVCVYPSFRSLLIQYNIFDSVRKFMIDPYYEENPDKDIDKRLSLGLPVPEEYMPKYDDESVFSDEKIINAE